MDDVEELFKQLENITDGAKPDTEKVIEQKIEENSNKKTFLKFDSATEEKMIVGYFYKDRSTFLKLAQYLVTKSWKKDSYFNDSKLQFIMNICYQYSSKYKKMPVEDIVFSFIEKSSMDTFLKEQTKKLFTELKDKDYTQYSPDYIKDVAVNFIKKERSIEATYACESEIQKGNYDNLDKIMREAVNVNLDKDLGVSIKNVAEVLPMVQEVHDPGRGCSWGSPSLDNNVGRVQDGEIGVIAGVPGAGKTAWLGHFATTAFKEGKNVALFSFEVNKQRLSTRFYKSLFKMDTAKLMQMEATEAAGIMEDPTVGDIRVICRLANSCSSNDMAAILNDLRTYEGWEPDLILVDYILITQTNDKKMDSSNTYKYYKTVSEELRNLAVEFNCPLVTAVQLNREAMGDKGGSKAVVTSKDISESRGVLDTADYVFIIEQTEKDKYIDEEKTKGIYKLRSDKNRNGNNGFYTQFDIDWKTMSISESKNIDKKKKQP